ncbi:MAG: hypothetical protein D6681_15900 [Calditrichaeota bacterium]|nr:MAG: hypothetical protein D6681_15900 [Calditrichota bacterium]
MRIRRWMTFRNLAFLMLLTFLCLDGLSCGKEEEVTDRTVIAKVGDRVINVHDFRISYELAPPGKKPSRGDALSRKQEYLSRMVEETLLTLAGLEKGVDQEEPVRRLLKWYEKKLVIEELYRQEIHHKVAVTEAEARQAFVMLNQKLFLRQIVVPSEAQAQALYQRLLNGESYETLAVEVAASDEELQRMLTPRQVTWGELEERFETAVFGLNLGETSAPIKTEVGYHLVQLVNRAENLILTENNFQARRHYIETIIRRRKEARLAREYLHRIGREKRPQAIGPVVRELANRAREALREEKTEKPLPAHAQVRQLRSYLADLEDRLLVVFEGGFWTVGQFLDLLEKSPPGARPDLTDPDEITVAIARMVRDEFLAGEGYRRGLQHQPAVQEELARIRDEVVAEWMRRAILDTVEVSAAEIQTFFTENIDWYRTPERVNIREIMVRDRRLADSLYRAIQNGADMAELAKRYSVRKWAAQKGGELGYFPRDAFGTVGEAAFAASAGELVGPVPVKIDTFTVGYSVFRVLDRQPAVIPPLSEVYDRVSKDALEAKKRQTLSRFLEAIKQRYPVTAHPELLARVKTTEETGTGRPMDFVAFRRW